MCCGETEHRLGVCIGAIHLVYKYTSLLANFHKLAKSISSASWSSFFDMLEYKAEWYGREVVKVPTFYPRSQTCGACGYKNADIKDLKVRKWTCPKCGAVHDRDRNAAVNILEKGMTMLAGQAAV